MLQYTDINFSDLKNLSVKSFTQVLINDFYPFIYSELNKMDDCLDYLKVDYDVDMLESVHKKIYAEFDELYRKEKLVLFPYIIKLDEENTKSENCSPFKNTKVHYTSMINHLSYASDIVANYFINQQNTENVVCLNTTLSELRTSMTEVQFIKEKHFFNHYKSCSGCSSNQLKP